MSEKDIQNAQVEDTNAEESAVEGMEEEKTSSPERTKAFEERAQTPPEEEHAAHKRTSKNLTKRLAVIVGACVVVLALSIGGLVSAFGSGGSEQVVQEQNDNDSSAANANARASSGSARTSGADEASAADTSADSTDAQTDTTQEVTGTEVVSGGQSATEVQTPSNNAPANTEQAQPQVVSVSLSVSCYDAVNIGNATAFAVSDNGAMRYASLTLNAGSSVYDALVSSGAAVGSSAGAMGMYIVSIDGLAQYDAGAGSGWKYYVNGVEVAYSSDKYILANGDSIEWRYVLNA